MPRNASGVFSLSGVFAIPNAVPSSSTINGYIGDLGDELTNSLDRDGKSVMRAHAKWGGYKITGLGDGTVATDAVAYGQLAPVIASAQSGTTSHAATVGGTADAITAVFSPAFTVLTAKMRFRFTATGANTIVNPTINIDSLGAKTIKKLNGVALAIGDIAGAGHVCDCVYDGTDVLLLNAAPWQTKSANVASAATVTLIPNTYTHITGTTAITDVDFSPAYDGAEATVVFDGILTLTHNATTLVLPGGTNITTAVGDTVRFIQDASDNVKCLAYQRSTGLPLGVGSIIQTVNTTSSAVVSSAGTIPQDDTIPQITEGIEVMTLAITPTSTTNKLKIETVVNISCNAASQGTCALFQDSTANALAAAFSAMYAASATVNICIIHYMTAGTTSATTFRVRCGANTGTVTFNGIGAARLYGGVISSSITITEIAA